MLGTLAKWLRILGYDTLYFKFAEDDFLKSLSEKEERILLTKDRELFEKCLNSYLVNSKEVKGQLIEVVNRFCLKKQESRCSVCNGELIKVSKESVKDTVPPYVFKTNEIFFKCASCGKVYWQGTHIDRINNFIEKVFLDRDCE